MKKKALLLANGWNDENLYHFLLGLEEALKEINIDVFTMLSHAAYSQGQNGKDCECSIFDLPELTDFDVIIIFGSGLNPHEIVEKVYSKVAKSGVPAISLGIRYPGFYYLGVDNYAGMKELCSHLIEKHGAKKIKFIAGPKGNVDSDERLKAVSDSMEEHGLSLASNDIFYSNWEVSAASMYAEHSFTDRESLPDAFVCANDPLAIHFSLSLEKNGFVSPDDVLLTGFDYLKVGRLFYPSLASVNQDYESIGQRCADIIKCIVSGRYCPQENVLPCRFLPGESCGCADCRDDVGLRQNYLRYLPEKDKINLYKEGRQKAMEDAILSSDRFLNLAEKLQGLFYKSNGREGDSFHILLDPDFSEHASEDEPTYTPITYAKRMSVIVSKEDSTPYQEISFDICGLVPGYAGEGPNHFYFLMPSYIDDYVCGYMVMRDHIEYAADMTYYAFMSRFNSVLAKYKQNLKLNSINAKLQELMQKDSLTNVRNRNAYDEAMTSLKEQYVLGDRTPFAVAMFDVNNLKRINDDLGHEFGDLYIKNACRLICDTFKHSPVYRIGGDEFVALIKNSDYEIRHDLLENFRKAMVELELSDLPPVNKVSVASGLGEYEEIEKNGFESIFKVADERMYENKYIMKNGEVR